MGLLQTFALVGLALPSAIMAANSEIYMDGSFNLHYPDGKQVHKCEISGNIQAILEFPFPVFSRAAVPIKLKRVKKKFK